MSVSCQDGDLTILTSVFEARFDDAYRYLDHCGETISRIKNIDRGWFSRRVDPDSSILLHTGKGLRLSFNQQRMTVARSSQDELKPAAALTATRAMAPIAQELYLLIADTLRVPNTIRVGARFDFRAKADSLEDAEQFLAKGLRSDLVDPIESTLSSTLYEAHSTFRLEDEESGIRRSVKIGKSGSVDPGDTPPGGLPNDAGQYVVEVDVDTYTRPTEGHFHNVSNFVQSSFTSSQNLSRRIFAELRSRQGKQQ